MKTFRDFYSFQRNFSCQYNDTTIRCFSIDQLHLLTCQRLLFLFNYSPNMISSKNTFCELNICSLLSIEEIKQAYEQ